MGTHLGEARADGFCTKGWEMNSAVELFSLLCQAAISAADGQYYFDEALFIP